MRNTLVYTCKTCNTENRRRETIIVSMRRAIPTKLLCPQCRVETIHAVTLEYPEAHEPA